MFLCLFDLFGKGVLPLSKSQKVLCCLSKKSFGLRYKNLIPLYSGKVRKVQKLVFIWLGKIYILNLCKFYFMQYVFNRRKIYEKI